LKDKETLFHKIKTMSQSKQIKAAIEKLHKKNSGDFQSLLREVEDRRRVIKLNFPQMVAALSPARTTVLQWGRRTGKTTFRNYRWAKINEDMPRSTGVFIGMSYQQILTRIVPSIIAGLEMFGIYKDLHYFIGKQAPRNWRTSWGRAYMPPEKHDHYITFWTGVGIHLISQDVKGDGRGITADWLDADECGELNYEKIESDVKPTISGTNTREFEKSRFFASELYTGTVPLTPDGNWFNKMEEDAIANPKQCAYIRATALDNKDNLRKGYLEEEKGRSTAGWIYDAEYLNIRPKFVKDGFYGMLDKDIHCYLDYDYSFYIKVGQHQDCRGDRDLVKGQPLILGIDWGHAINCLTVNQHLKTINEYRTLKDFFVLGEDGKIQDDLFQDFHNYYHYHQSTNKDLYLWYDNTGNVHTGVTRKKRAEMARDFLRAKGWKVHLMTLGGKNPQHDEKYLLWQMILSEKDHRLPKYRMNQGNCKWLYISMKNAKAKRKSNKLIEKDKSSEKSKRIKRQEATDFSDANDTPIHGLFKRFLTGFHATLPNSRIISH